jgi:hypothetical protein
MTLPSWSITTIVPAPGLRVTSRALGYTGPNGDTADDEAPDEGNDEEGPED